MKRNSIKWFSHSGRRFIYPVGDVYGDYDDIISDDHDDVYNDGWLLDKFGCWGNFSDTNCRVPQREVSAGRQNINCIFGYLDLVFVFLFEELFRHKLSERSQRQSPKYPRKTLITSSAAPFSLKIGGIVQISSPRVPRPTFPPHCRSLLPLFSQLQIIVNWQGSPTNALILTQLSWVTMM